MAAGSIKTARLRTAGNFFNAMWRAHKHEKSPTIPLWVGGAQTQTRTLGTREKYHTCSRACKDTVVYPIFVPSHF